MIFIYLSFIVVVVVVSVVVDDDVIVLDFVFFVDDDDDGSSPQIKERHASYKSPSLLARKSGRNSRPPLPPVSHADYMNKIESLGCVLSML